MTYVDTSDISAQMFITVLLFLLIIAPLISLGVLRFFKLKEIRIYSYWQRRCCICTISAHYIFHSNLNSTSRSTFIKIVCAQMRQTIFCMLKARRYFILSYISKKTAS